mmetsp:Transcript_19623/g.78076  ORF Transcript_19623/g.78076 Transcript_19623/m.78076 type:complete len:359 (+) Transcript_19623:27-1103(+)
MDDRRRRGPRAPGCAAFLVVVVAVGALKEEEPVQLPRSIVKNGEKATWEIVASAVVPHGDFAFDPTLLPASNQNASWQLHAAAVDVGAFFRDRRVEAVLVLTPHGISAEGVVAAYDASTASGFARLGDDLHNASFPDYDVPLNATLDAALTAALSAASPQVTLLQAWADSEPFPLRWGEAIPLLLLRDGGLPETTPLAVASMPGKRTSKASNMTASMRLLGRTLRRALTTTTTGGDDVSSLPEKIRLGVLVSGDLAHTHAADGPYGFSQAAGPFDEAVGAFLRDPARGLTEAKQYVDDALVCGWPGMAMLWGILEAEVLAGRRVAAAQPVVGPFHPTYYGMAVAAFAHDDTYDVESST